MPIEFYMYIYLSHKVFLQKWEWLIYYHSQLKTGPCYHFSFEIHSALINVIQNTFFCSKTYNFYSLGGGGGQIGNLKLLTGLLEGCLLEMWGLLVQ